MFTGSFLSLPSLLSIPSFRPFPRRHRRTFFLHPLSPRRFLHRGREHLVLSNFIDHFPIAPRVLPSTRSLPFSSSLPSIRSNLTQHKCIRFVDVQGMRRIHPCRSFASWRRAFSAAFFRLSRCCSISLSFRWDSIRVAKRKRMEESKEEKDGKRTRRTCRSSKSTKWEMERRSTSTFAFDRRERASKVPTLHARGEACNDRSGRCLLECRRGRAASQPWLEGRKAKEKETCAVVAAAGAGDIASHSRRAWTAPCRKKRKERIGEAVPASRRCDAR